VPWSAKRIAAGTAALCCAGLIALSLISARGSAQAGGGRCFPPGAKTLARDRGVRVYSLKSSARLARLTYACLLRSGATIALQGARGAALQSLGNFALAEGTLAYSDYQHGVDSGCTGITVIDVAHRHTLLRLAQVGCTVDAGFIRLGQVSDVVVTPGGAVAWIVSTGDNRARSFQVGAARAPGSQRLLDQGPAIVPGSLRIAGAVASWQDGARRLSARLR
jgi:hypothetical protein